MSAVYSLMTPERTGDAGGLIRLRVLESLTLPSPAKPASRFEFGNALRKLLFFLRWEGIAMTVRKVRTARAMLALENQRCVRLLFAESAEQEDGAVSYLAISPDYSADLNVATVPIDWCLQLETPLPPLSRVLDALQRSFDVDPDAWCSVSEYSPFSGDAPASTVARYLLDACSSIGCAAQRFSAVGIAAEVEAPLERLSPVATPASSSARRGYDLFLVGAGAYPTCYVLPALQSANRRMVVDLNPLCATRLAEQQSFEQAATDWRSMLQPLRNAHNPAVIIASYHSTHVPLTAALLSERSDLRVLVEKPPVTTKAQLDQLLALHDTRQIEIGFNRRFAPFSLRARSWLAEECGPITITASIKELKLPPSHWYYWPSQGSRVTGNLCHWLDLACFFISAAVKTSRCVSAAPNGFDETAISVVFEDESMLVLSASDRGCGVQGVQEWIEIRRGAMTVVIEDFRRMRVTHKGRCRVYRSWHRDKGHLKMYQEFEQRLLANESFSYSTEDLERSAGLMLKVVDELAGQRLGSD